MDEAKRTINATESGLEKIEVMLGIENIYADPSGQLANHFQQALKAQSSSIAMSTTSSWTAR